MSTRRRIRRSTGRGSAANGLRSLAGHLYREARGVGHNAYAEGLREAALIASRRASRIELAPRKRAGGAKKK